MTFFLLFFLAQVTVTQSPAVRSTNMVTQLKSALPTLCVECGQSNHHDMVVTRWAAFDQVRVTTVIGTKTNVTYATGNETNWFTTNLVLTVFRREQPGWQSPPPLPGSPEQYPLSSNRARQKQP